IPNNRRSDTPPLPLPCLPIETAGADVAPVMRTSASPPLTSSGRDDSTSMLRVCASTLVAARDIAKNAPAIATDVFKIALFTSRPPRSRLIVGPTIAPRIGLNRWAGQWQGRCVAPAVIGN